MAAPRKVFRIEETARLSEQPGDGCSPHAELMAAVSALRATLAAANPRSDRSEPRQDAEAMRFASALDRVGGVRDERAASIERVGRELKAVVTSTEQATQKVLGAAEQIDQLANNLSAALKGKIERGIAQDIQDFVIQIFEACNFQDLAGQRITKVMAVLDAIEAQIGRLFDEFRNAAAAPRRDGAQFLYGPRLDVDRGHAAQVEIDTMFRSRHDLADCD
jgi:chemotaxis protein CheZ